MAAAADYTGEGSKTDGNIGEDGFRQLSDGSHNIDWSIGDAATAQCNAEWIDMKKKAFYNAGGAGGASAVAPITFFDPGKYKPKNAHGYSQKLIMTLLLHHLKHWMEYDAVVKAIYIAHVTVTGVGPPPSLNIPARQSWHRQGFCH